MEKWMDPYFITFGRPYNETSQGIHPNQTLQAAKIF
jgi:hypothetical protein